METLKICRLILKTILLASVLALTWLSLPVSAGQLTNADIFEGETRDLQKIAQRAYVWGMPLVAAAQVRYKFTTAAGSKERPLLNRFIHSRKLMGPEFRAGVGPNNDTIYSIAFLDLQGGPFVFTAPDFCDQYYTFSMCYDDTSSDLSLGQRTHGSQLPPVFIHGAEYKGPIPEGMYPVKSHTRYMIIGGRILANGSEDYPAVHQLQDQVGIAAYRQDSQSRTDFLAASPMRSLRSPASHLSNELVFLDMLGNVLKDWQVETKDRDLVASFAQMGLTPELGFQEDSLNDNQRPAVKAGLQQGKEAVLQRSLHLGIETNGWTTNYQGPRFGQDYLLRAGVAKDQIYVAIPEESVYPIGRVDREGRPLDGHHRYRIRFEAGKLPPVGAFWSITAYDDNGFMIDNPINRYSIGDRTRGLRYRADGSLDILLQYEAPADSVKGNWLPVPEAPFYLMMRLYIPGDEVLSAAWEPPAIERIPEY